MIHCELVNAIDFINDWCCLWTFLNKLDMRSGLASFGRAVAIETYNPSHFY